MYDPEWILTDESGSKNPHARTERARRRAADKRRARNRRAARKSREAT